jgi:iron-chelate-transporting ATPase
VLHDLDQAAAVADRVALLQHGRVRGVGTPQEVLTPEALSSTYGIRIDVERDPHTQQLRARPVGRHTLRLRATPA